jgi:hypothetical protein
MKEEEAEIKLSKMADLLLAMRDTHAQLIEHLAVKHKGETAALRASVAALSTKLDEVSGLINSQTYIKSLAKRAKTIDQDLHAAYLDGFACGADHGNLQYKYPPANLAWQWSETRSKLYGPATLPHQEWYHNGEVTDIPEEVIS